MIRTFVLRMLLAALGRVMVIVQKFDPAVRREWSVYPEGTRVALIPHPGARPLVLLKEGGVFSPASGEDSEEAWDYRIVFKSARIAWPVLTGAKRVEQAFLEHGVVVFGDIMNILPLVRGVLMVERHIGMRPKWRR